MAKTKTACVYPIVTAVVTAENAFLGRDRKWKAVNKMQRRFLKELELCRTEAMTIPEIESRASRTAEPLNEFLRSKNFQIQLDPFPVLPPPFKAWGAASVLDLAMLWFETGTKTTIVTPTLVQFSGFALSQQIVQFFTQKKHPHPIVSVQTKTDDRVFMTMFSRDLRHFDLLAAAVDLSLATDRCYDFAGLHVPMVDLDQMVDISWLKKMGTKDNEGFDNEITQALQQTKLKMNAKGARVKSAVAIGGMLSTSVSASPKPPHIINKPFLMWVTRPGLTKPLFVGRITEENWKDPGSLEDM